MSTDSGLWYRSGALSPAIATNVMAVVVLNNFQTLNIILHWYFKKCHISEFNWCHIIHTGLYCLSISTAICTLSTVFDKNENILLHISPNRKAPVQLAASPSAVVESQRLSDTCFVWPQSYAHVINVFFALWNHNDFINLNINSVQLYKKPRWWELRACYTSKAKGFLD